MPEQPTLFDDLDIAVHCFFDCPEVVRDADPENAHKAMQAHYQAVHAEDVARAIAFMR
jgi:hypothetical protein